MRTLLLLLILGLPASGFEVPGFELVQSFPAETSLERPGVRAASAVWPEMFAAAKERIDIAEFYVTAKAGEPLDAALDELEKAGKRGVKIRFLAEKKMADASKDGFERLRKVPNLELRIIDFSKVKKDGILHAKYMVVDDTQAYIGSQNFDWRSLKHIHELGLRVSDALVVRDAEVIFSHDWKVQKMIEEDVPVRVLNTQPLNAPSRRAYLVASPFEYVPPTVGDSQTELVRLINAAQKDLAIQLLDYAPLTRSKRFYPPIDNALRDASVRGVKIKLLVSHWNTEENALPHLKSLAMLPGIEVRVCTIPESKDGPIPFSRVIHAKYMVHDGALLWLGTSNWSGGYLDNSRNLEVVVKDEKLAAEVLAIHSHLWDSPYTEKLDVAKDYPKPRR